MAHQFLLGQSLHIIEASRSYSGTPIMVGLLWASDQPDTETSTWQHSTLATDRHPTPPPPRDSIPQSQLESGRKPTTWLAQPPWSAPWNLYFLLTWLNNIYFYNYFTWQTRFLRFIYASQSASLDDIDLFVVFSYQLNLMLYFMAVGITPIVSEAIVHGAEHLK